MILRGVKRALMSRTPRLLAELLRLKANWNRDLFTFLQILRLGDTVVDVGANIGGYTEAFASVVGEGGLVHAFEPVPDTFRQLTARFCDQAKWSQVALHQIALGDDERMVEIVQPGSDSGQASLKRHTVANWSRASVTNSFEVPCRTLDRVMSEQRIAHLDLLKIDVEGAELQVLNGAADVLQRYRPMLFLEVWEQWTRDFGYRPEDIADLLERSGYDRFVTVGEKIVEIPNLRQAWAPALGRGPHNLFAAISSVHGDRVRALCTRL